MLPTEELSEPRETNDHSDEWMLSGAQPICQIRAHTYEAQSGFTTKPLHTRLRRRYALCFQATRKSESALPASVSVR